MVLKRPVAHMLLLQVEATTDVFSCKSNPSLNTISPLE